MTSFWAVRIGVGRRPVAGHQLVGNAPVEECARLAEPAVEMAMQLVIHELPVQFTIRSLEKAVE